MKYAVIENNLVVNIVEAESDFAAQMGWITYPEYINNQVVGIGWQYDGVNWTPPAETTPETTPEETQQISQGTTDETATTN